MTRPNVLGVDPSLTSTGISAESGLATIRSSPSDHQPPTLEDRRRRLVRIVRDVVAYAPVFTDLVVIESPSLGQARQGGTLDRNGLFWLLVDEFAGLKIPVVDVTPATVKKFATGNGGAKKPDLRMALYKRTDLDIADDNQVDAWWLAEIGRHLLTAPSISLPYTHVKALEKVTLPHPDLEVST